MENCNKDYYYATSDGGGGVAVACLYDWIKVLDGQFNDMSINLTIWEGRDTTGTIVAERIDGEWRFRKTDLFSIDV